jgi:hypothetical protein
MYSLIKKFPDSESTVLFNEVFITDEERVEFPVFGGGAIKLPSRYYLITPKLFKVELNALYFISDDDGVSIIRIYPLAWDSIHIADDAFAMECSDE